MTLNYTLYYNIKSSHHNFEDIVLLQKAVSDIT